MHFLIIKMENEKIWNVKMKMITNEVGIETPWNDTRFRLFICSFSNETLPIIILNALMTQSYNGYQDLRRMEVTSHISELFFHVWNMLE